MTSASLLLFLHTLSGGMLVTQVSITNSLHPDDLGYVTERNPTVINVAPTDPEEMKYVAVHEYCHLQDFKQNLSLSDQYPFGRLDFVTDYARTNRQEDWAETCAQVLLKKPIRNTPLLNQKKKIVVDYFNTLRP